MFINNMKFDKNTKFLVTGGAGFIGSNLCEELLSGGYFVRCLDDFSNGKKENIVDFLDNENFELIEGDIRNFEVCLNSTNGINIVFHEAAWGSVPRSIEMPQFYHEVNVVGTLNMLEASRLNKIDKFIYASSSSVYGDNPSLPKKIGNEGSLLSPYALTKSLNEQYAKLYSDLYGLNTIGLRYFNVFGRKQNPNGNYAAVIPKFIIKLINNEIPIIYGDGSQSRDFTYIDNVIYANISSCFSTKENSGKVFNVACGKRFTLIETYDYIKKFIGSDTTPSYMESRKGDIMHSQAYILDTIDNLDYKVQVEFEQGLKETIRWFISNSKYYD